MKKKYVISMSEIFSDRIVYFSENGNLYSGLFDTRKCIGKQFETINQAELSIENLMENQFFNNRDYEKYNVVFSIEPIYIKEIEIM